MNPGAITLQRNALVLAGPGDRAAERDLRDL
jgi:hypothetical protein